MNLPKVDFHIHAVYYREHDENNVMTVETIVRRFEELSFQAIGIVDHLDTRPGHSCEYIKTIVKESKTVSSESLSIFLGAELNIENDRGDVSGSEETKEEFGLDYLLAGIHGSIDETLTTKDFLDGYHRALMGTVERHDFVDAIAHPWCVALDEHKDRHFENIPEKHLDEFVHALADRGKAVEVSCQLQCYFDNDAYRGFIGKLIEKGVRVEIGSDAHDVKSIGRSEQVREFLEEVGFSPEQVWMPRNSVFKEEAI